VILIDSSAWIEFLRNTSSPVCERVDELLDDDIAICDPIRMEILAGARDDRHLRDLRRLLARATNLPTWASNYEEAASLHRICRRGGETVRRLIDCFIASVAIREDIPVLHRDADYEVLSRHTELRIELLQ
jgi:predicted nucleic acid-binding protein